MITIFVHGTKPFWPLIKVPLVYHFFHSPDGLVHVKQFEKKFHLSKVMKQLSKAAPADFAAENNYIFGWSGSLSFTARKQAAQKLYEQIKKLDKPIRMITHSHGGNVALNVATVAQKKADTSFAIEELILLACPVQEATQSLVSSPIFKKVFSLHSHLDMLQVIDPQGLSRKPFFSQRHFKDSDNLIQAEITFKRRKLLHVDFLLKPFISQLPVLLDYLKNAEKKPVNQDGDVVISLPLSKGYKNLGKPLTSLTK